MGSFYGNVTLRGPQQPAVTAYLEREGRAAYVSPTVGQATVVYDGAEGDAALAAALSRVFTCPALAVRVHDSDILQYTLYDAGARTDAYDSWPGYFDEDADDDAPVVPSGGDPRRLCAAFAAAGAVDAVAAILQATADDDRYVLADDRHGDLCRALGLPAIAVGLGYRSLDRGELPPGLARTALRKTG